MLIFLPLKFTTVFLLVLNAVANVLKLEDPVVLNQSNIGHNKGYK